jgi:phage shock protein E
MESIIRARQYIEIARERWLGQGGLKMPKDIHRDEVQRLVASGAQLVEILPSPEYEEDHLPGAIHLPLRHVDAGGVEVLDRNRAVIVYCWDVA